MSPLNIIRAWKDEEYRQNLAEEEQAQLPEHPSGLIELEDVELDQVAGGMLPLKSANCPFTYNWNCC